ncbi:MAG: hypothetical protein OQJ80_08845 [Kangiella sp.]|jgi:glutathione synthase/RimK-type ligase-like ATP-grasp enzyme|nr:hypothetical protein [Kangiella sp.]
MKIAIATRHNLPDWEQDDQPFFQALTGAGIQHDVVPWDSNTAWGDYDLCLIRTTWDYQERFSEFTDWIKSVSQQTRLCNPESVIHWNSHKSYLRELEQNGIQIAPSVWLEHGQAYNIKTIMAEKGWKSGFIKPLIGANARECCRFDNSQQGLATAQAHIDRLISDEDLVVQPYLSTVETFGETSGIFFNNQFSHGTRKVPVQGDFRVQDDYGAKDYPYQLSDDEVDLANKAMGYVCDHYLPSGQNHLLYARVDFLHDADGTPYLNEMELIEPSLFFRHGGKKACDTLVSAIQTTKKQWSNT